MILSKIWRTLRTYNNALFLSESEIKDSAIYKASPLHKLNFEQKLAKEKNKKVYAIFDDGAILLDRVSNKIKIYGQVIIIEPDKDNSI